jgi:hypothetical protein
MPKGGLQAVAMPNLALLKDSTQMADATSVKVGTLHLEE